jgi:PAS domain S-box-containing protein
MSVRTPPTGLWLALGVIAAPFLALIALQTYQALYHVPALTRSRDLVVHTFEVISTAQALDQALQDAERGERGFLITGELAYLDPYRTGIRNAPVLLEKLTRLTANNPEQQRRLPNLAHQIDIKLSELQRAVVARERNGFEAAQRIVQTDVGFDAMLAINGLIDATVAAENQLLTERLGRAAQDERRGGHLALVGATVAALTMLLGMVLAILAFRNLQRLEAARRAGEQRLGLLVDGVADHALYMVDTQGYVTDWNAGAERLKGFTAQEIVGQHFSCLFTPEDQEAGAPQNALESAARDGTHTAEYWRTRKDGSRFLATVAISALRDPSGRPQGFALITRDTTELRQQQQALEQTRAMLAQSQKMQALGQLTGGIAHDFNNLLHVIKNAAAMLRLRMRNEEVEVRRYLDMVERNADRAATVTHRLLAFSRQQPLEPKPADANKLVREMAELLRGTLGESVALENVVASGLWMTSVDASQLETAILNLAINARDAMSGSGKLTIETTNAFLDESYVAAHDEVAVGQYVMIAVSDTGTGMNKEVIAKAFDPFFTTKEPGHGTGLGLSQVFGFVKQSGGHVKIYSEPGEGTTVKVYLPRLAAAPGHLDAEVALVPAGAAGETILVVEDDEDVRAFTADVLGEFGYRVAVASDGVSALATLEKLPSIDLLFTDVGLPNGMNGRQLAEEAQQRRPGLKVLFTTGYARNAIVHQGRLDPGVELIVKPFTHSSLADKVRRVLDAKSGLPPGELGRRLEEGTPG